MAVFVTLVAHLTYVPAVLLTFPDVRIPRVRFSHAVALTVRCGEFTPPFAGPYTRRLPRGGP